MLLDHQSLAIAKEAGLLFATQQRVSQAHASACSHAAFLWIFTVCFKITICFSTYSKWALSILSFVEVAELQPTTLSHESWLSTVGSAETATLMNDTAARHITGFDLLYTITAACVLLCAELQAMAGHL